LKLRDVVLIYLKLLLNFALRLPIASDLEMD